MTVTFNRDPSRGLVRVGDLELPPSPPFIIADLVHDACTVIFGRPEAGKSYVSLALAASMTTGAPFLGLYPVRERHKVAILALDMGQAREIRRRQNMTPMAGLDDVLILTKKPGNDARNWQDLASELRAEGVTVIIIDNLRRIMPPGRTVRGDDDAADVLDNCVEELGRAGIAVVLIHHAGKPGEDGQPRTSPMGATGIEAWARHLVRVDVDKNGYRELTAWGNDLDKGTVIAGPI